jgi:hypothetical protein
MEGYYVYLPAVFIHGGFEELQVRDTAYLRHWEGTQKIYTKYTSGVAIMEAPFFLIAHAMSKPLGFASDGYSRIYSYALMMAAIFYLVFGLGLLYFILIRHFTAIASLFAMGGLLFGTNLYYYSFFQPSMSHVYSFFLFSALIFLTDKIIHDFLRAKKYITWLLLGLVSGLIVLIRPTNAIIFLYPAYLLWKDWDYKSVPKPILFKYLSLAAAMFILVWIPQLIYWKTVTGQWFVWSYGDENFRYWQEPKLIRVLIDPWNGWLLYSPLVIFAIVGLFMRNAYNENYNRVMRVILLIATYIFASWWAWWFGGAFGHRSYVEYYAILAIPFAQFITVAFTKKWSMVLFILFYFLLIYYNLGLTYQYMPPWDGPGWTYGSVWNEVCKLFRIDK